MSAGAEACVLFVTASRTGACPRTAPQATKFTEFARGQASSVKIELQCKLHVGKTYVFF